MTVRTSDFDFDLPDELIAQRPPVERGQSRLLVLSRQTGAIEHSSFARLADHLRPGDLLVVNDTRVFPARLVGHRVPSGGAVECLLLRKLPDAPDLPDPESRIPSPEVLGSTHAPGSEAKTRCPRAVRTRRSAGCMAKFWRDTSTAAGRFGCGPRAAAWRSRTRSSGSGTFRLPPYIARPDEASDRERYQTVYAREAGSVAAPTAGLHFTDRVLDELRTRGVERVSLTLHVGYGTFKPVRVENVDEHEVDPEFYTVSPSTAEALTNALQTGRRIIAVGTTTTRALESLTVDASGRVQPSAGSTSLFIHPSHRFRIVQGLITNFHLPRSSLLMLVAAFAGRERILAAYREAVDHRYRFYSYGDAMLIV